MEFFDVLDCTAEKTGETIERNEAHRTGAWHGAFHCLIVSQRDGKWTVLFQKRSASKKIAPGKFDVSVGGHYSSGEDAHAAGPREIKEELGLDVAFSELIPLGRRVFTYCFTPGVRECEFQDVYLLHRDLGATDLSLQKEELDGVIQLDIDDGIALLSGSVRDIESSLIDPFGKTRVIRITSDAFVPCLDNYYLKLLLVAKRFASGDRHVLVI
jgi:isopentenyldiphosphate isomerase